MPSVLLGMGSNIHPERYLLQAAKAIRCLDAEVQFSRVYQSAAVGMQGDDFLNACCLIMNINDFTMLPAWLKGLEDQHGRDRSEGSWKPRTLDLDLLMHGDEVLDDDLYQYAHVYVPAAELIELKLPTDKLGLLTQTPLRL